MLDTELRERVDDGVRAVELAVQGKCRKLDELVGRRGERYWSADH
jgi:hypothetical protein